MARASWEVITPAWKSSRAEASLVARSGAAKARSQGGTTVVSLPAQKSTITLRTESWATVVCAQTG